MKRIIWMVLVNFLHAPIWLFRISRMGRPKDRHTEKYKYEYLRRMVQRINRRGMVTVETHGVENLPAGEGFIMFPNHQGLFDALALIEASPHCFGIIIKKEAYHIILVKQVVNLLHGIPMDRSDIKSSLMIIREMAEQVKQGRNYVIFAEGTRSRNGNQILPFKGGSFKSATIAHCPIVPVALIDSFKPFDSHSLKAEKVQVHFLKPIYSDQYMGMKTHEIADMVHDKIEQTISENT